jgi:hypothetical protein
MSSVDYETSQPQGSTCCHAGSDGKHRQHSYVLQQVLGGQTVCCINIFHKAVLSCHKALSYAVNALLDQYMDTILSNISFQNHER